MVLFIERRTVSYSLCSVFETTLGYDTQDKKN